MKIERMEVGDLRQVSRLAEQLGYPVTEFELEKRFHEIENKSDFALFVAKANSSDVLGWIQVNAEPASLLIGPRADIAALVVDENLRGQGIGKALLAHAENWAKGSRLGIVRVRSNLKREDAHRFYLREGYRLSKTSNIFTKEVGD